MTIATCKGCHTLIDWRKTPKGKNMPLDPEPHPEGNIVLTEDGLAVVAAVGSQPKMYRSHWATCPDAAAFRRKKAPTATKGARAT